MVDPRYITITVQYDRELKYPRSLEWIAPELNDSALTMTGDHLGDPNALTDVGGARGRTHVRTVREGLAAPQRRRRDERPTRGRDRDLATRTYTFDGISRKPATNLPSSGCLAK